MAVLALVEGIFNYIEGILSMGMNSRALINTAL